MISAAAISCLLCIVDEGHVVVCDTTQHSRVALLEERQLEPFRMAIQVLTSTSLVELDSSRVRAMVARAAWWAVLVVCKFSIGSRVPQLSLAVSATVNCDSVPAINTSQVPSYIALGSSTEHHGCLCAFPSTKISHFSAVVGYVLRNCSITRD
jgi:hypothetical protein